MKTNIEVCNKEDCPLYSFYNDINEHPEVARANAKMEELADTAKKTNESVDLRAKISLEFIHKLTIKSDVENNCLACKHFKKVDVYEILIAEQAKHVLSEK